MSTPPLKRHPSLQPLSREHFNGLVQARRLEQAAAATPEEKHRVLSDFAAAWRAEIAPHFDDEERLLIPLSDRENAARLVREHDQIRAAVADLLAPDGADGDRMRTLGRLLHDHIRWEERVFFEHIQAAAGEHVLEQIHTETREIERHRPGSRRRGDLRVEEPPNAPT